MDEHKRHVYMDDRDAGTYNWSCSCGKRDINGGYLHRLYAIDGWREAHGLDPIINYPLV